MRIAYPTTGGFKKKGKTDTAGNWQYSWLVRAQFSGQAAIGLDLQHGKNKRHYTVRFSVIVPSPTPPSAPTSTPTAIPTAGTSPTATTVPTAATSTPSATSVPTVQPTQTAKADIELKSIALYTDISASGPLGTPQSSFSNTTPQIHAWASFSKWIGYHEVAFNWYTPQGTLYSTGTDHSTDNGPADSTDFIDVAGHDAANLTGQWRVAVVIDGRTAASAKFFIFSGDAPTTGAITLQDVHFYTGVDSQGDPIGSPQTEFPDNITAVYAYAVWSQWEGAHSVTFNWYDPQDNLYDSYTDTSTDTGSATDWSYLYVDGQDAADRPGEWTVDIVVDGTTVASRHFTLTQT